MKQILNFLVTNQLVLGICTFIGGLAAIGYFWDKISPWLSKVICIQQSDIKHIFQFIFTEPWVLGIATFIGGLAAIGYFWDKISPWLSKGVFRMTQSIKDICSPQNLEPPTGQVPLNSPFYVERPPIEKDCYDAISRPGALIRIKAPRQMGKSSLMARVLDHAVQKGCRSVTVYFQQANNEIFADLDLFLRWFCARISHDLNLENKVEIYWQGFLGSKDKTTDYFKKYLLTEITEPLALGMDEVDLGFHDPKILTDFLALLRAWHERGKNEEVWKKLRLFIVHSREVYIPLNMNQSPFNVGLAAELPELTEAQTDDLAKRHGLNFPPDILKALMKMLGGHPYLLRAAFYDLARKRSNLKELVKTAPTEKGTYADHLRWHLSNLEKDEKLKAAMKQVIATDKPVKIGSDETFKLRNMGLVKFQGDGNAVIPLCDLYRKYFGERLN